MATFLRGPVSGPGETASFGSVSILDLKQQKLTRLRGSLLPERPGTASPRGLGCPLPGAAHALRRPGPAPPTPIRCTWVAPLPVSGSTEVTFQRVPRPLTPPRSASSAAPRPSAPQSPAPSPEPCAAAPFFLCRPPPPAAAPRRVTLAVAPARASRPRRALPSARFAENPSCGVGAAPRPRSASSGCAEGKDNALIVLTLNSQPLTPGASAALSPALPGPGPPRRPSLPSPASGAPPTLTLAPPPRFLVQQLEEDVPSPAPCIRPLPGLRGARLPAREGQLPGSSGFLRPGPHPSPGPHGPPAAASFLHRPQPLSGSSSIYTPWRLVPGTSIPSTERKPGGDSGYRQPSLRRLRHPF
ncbi:formin-2-like [Physeter macrocephalus]|uniref:Formin-2-like n=1 Tax=Physeter macrocephalus TaxID=9755 RepID=A0A9W2WBV9_PHYMC|nr:formin-2-like [Physeter catodon]